MTTDTRMWATYHQKPKTVLHTLYRPITDSSQTVAPSHVSLPLRSPVCIGRDTSHLTPALMRSPQAPGLLESLAGPAETKHLEEGRILEVELPNRDL